MSGLLSLFGVIALIAAIILVQLLRSLLAAPFPAQVRLRALAQTRPPETLAPLFEEADAALVEAGFAHLGWVLVQTTPEETPGPRLNRLYLSADRRMMVQVIAPFLAHEPYHCRLHLVSQGADGRLLFTAPTMIQVLPPDAGLADTQMAAYASLDDQMQAHQTLVARHGDAVPWTDLDNARERLQVYEDALRTTGDLLPHPDGGLRLTVPRALAALRSMFSQPKATQDGNAEVPLKRAILYWRNQRQATRHSPRMPVQLGLFVLSALAFAALGAWFWNLHFAIVLLAVIALHEAGHWWAMRAFGYRNVQMLMLPMVGGVTIGHEQTPSAQARAWVSLMGPLPGVVLGCVLFLADVNVSGGWLFTAALLLLMINLFNLLPILPLDGGHLLHLMLPERAVKVRMVFDVLAIAALAALAWWLDAWWLVLLALVPFGNLRNAGRDRRLLAALRQTRTDSPPRSETDAMEQALTVVRADAAKPLPLATQFALAEQVLKQAQIEPMPRRAWLQLAALWLGCFAATLALPQVRNLIASWLTPALSSEAISSAIAGYQAEARALPISELVREVLAALPGADVDGTVAAPATDDDLAVIEQRLGQPLDPVWRTVLQSPGGEQLLQALDLDSPARLHRLSDRRDCLDWIEQDANWPGFAAGDPVTFNVIDIALNDTDNHDRALDRERLSQWLVLGSCDQDSDSLRLVEADAADWPMWELILSQPFALRDTGIRTRLEQLYTNLRFSQRINGD